ncbi:hypothetical protein BGX33_004435 [Mortierella sp. NVP41]|nr:hypothetical protein BGX33_004435 [Mortierella sp. NVP41]
MVHGRDTSVREILQAVILQEGIESVVVHGAVTPRRARLDTGELEDDLALSVKLEANVKAWAEFLVAIRFKVTELSLRDDSQMQLLQALKLNEVKALQMSRLRSFSLRSGMDWILFERSWLELFLESKGPATPQIFPDGASTKVSGPAATVRAHQEVELQAITEFRLIKVIVTPDEWERLLRCMDFSQMVKFEVHQRDPMFKETLLQLTDVVLGAGPALQQFVVRNEKGIDEKTVAAPEEKFRPKSVGAGADINLNGFIV